METTKIVEHRLDVQLKRMIDLMKRLDAEGSK